MAKHFADHLIIKEEIYSRIESFVPDAAQRKELVELVDGIFHHHILDLVLTHLPGNHHTRFLELVKDNSDPKTAWEFIKTRVTVDIESEIKSKSAKITKEILADINKSRTRR